MCKFFHCLPNTDIFNRANCRTTDMIVQHVVFENVVQHFQSVVSFAAYNSIWSQKSFARRSLRPRCHQKSFVIPSIPIQRCPSMKKIVKTSPTVFFGNGVYSLRIVFAGHNVTHAMVLTVYVNIHHVFDLVKGSGVNVQMYWLLIKKECIISFRNVFTSIIKYTVRITSAKRITKLNSPAGFVFLKPRPK